MKKTIVHIIYNLGRAGAETMLVSTIKELKEYTNIVVTLNPENHFAEELQCDQYYCLNVQSLFLLPFAAIKLRRILKKVGADMVHTHLFWPTVVARLGTPKKIPLLTTIHSFIANSVEYRNLHIRFIDKITYRIRKSIIIAVAKGALKEYFDFLRIKPYRSYALYTFADIKKFNRENSLPAQNDGSVVRLITVGALREQKTINTLSGCLNS